MFLVQDEAERHIETLTEHVTVTNYSIHADHLHQHLKAMDNAKSGHLLKTYGVFCKDNRVYDTVRNAFPTSSSLLTPLLVPKIFLLKCFR